MRSRRFPAIDLTEWRSRLVDAHPGLFPDARPVAGADGPELGCAGWPSVPDGWRRIVERACARLAAAVGDGPGALIVSGMDEKWGTLRLDVSADGVTDATWEAATLAVDLAEARSAHVCSACGRPGRLWSNDGWLGAWCDEHGEGRPEAHGDHVTVVARFEGGMLVRSARRYVVEEDRFVPAPVPEE